MRVLATQYSLSTSSIDVYFAGCKGPHCINCHNPESWNLEGGESQSAKYIACKIAAKSIEHISLVKNIMLFGGEPLDQPIEELEEFLSHLSLLGLPIWLFTRYDIEDVPFSIRVKCHFIKTGRYLEELKTDDNVQYGIKLATSNQKILRRGYDY